VSTGGEIVFVICAVVAIVAAVLTVSLRSPLRAAVALLTNILALAGLYVTLHAHLLAAIQLLVYAGAVVVLFVFVIMLIGPSAMPRREDHKGLALRTGAGALMAMVTAGIAFSVATVARPYVDLDQCAGAIAECGQFGGVESLSRALFRNSAVPFELVSVLLLVAIIAAVAVARGHGPEQKKALEQNRNEPARRAASHTE
jgi:NADH-quinone oxidoreductase subunit J